MQPRSIRVIAHRGASIEAPENTLKSFKKAIEIGADYIEFDLRFSKDRKLVIIHDDSLKRITGFKGKVRAFTSEQLAQLDAGEGEHIPTLEEVIQICKGKIKLQIEIKEVGIAPVLFNCLNQNHILDTVLISSYIHSELDTIKNLNFHIPCATLDPSGFAWITAWIRKKGMIINAKGRNFNGIHPFHRVINQKFVRLTHAAGLFVNPYTVDDPKRIHTLLKWGVDGIITNDPRQLKGILQELDL